MLHPILNSHHEQRPDGGDRRLSRCEGWTRIGRHIEARKKMLRVRSRRKSVEIAVPQSKSGETTTIVRWVWQLPDDKDLLRPYQQRLLREQKENKIGSVETVKQEP